MSRSLIGMGHAAGMLVGFFSPLVILIGQEFN